MEIHVQNIFTHVPVPTGQERSMTLLQNDEVTIESIVSHTHSSPPGFWYDQEKDEWVMLVRGQATLQFEDGERVELKVGDFLTIPRRVKHCVYCTDSQTVWLAVKIAVRP